VGNIVNEDLIGPWQDQLRHAENEIKAARDLIRRVAERSRKDFAADDVFPRSVPADIADLLASMERALESAESRVSDVTDSIELLQARQRRNP
jgi:predicted glycosyltransferase